MAQTGTCLNGDCQTGTGKYQDASGNVYEGGFENGVFNGRGTLTLVSGDICSGWFLNGIENLNGNVSSIMEYVKVSKSNWALLCGSSEKVIRPTLFLPEVNAADRQTLESQIGVSQTEFKTAIHNLKTATQALLDIVDEINDKVMRQTDLSNYQTELNNRSNSYNSQTEIFKAKFGGLFETISQHRASLQL
ncbi:MAG: hypothetical protein R3C61_02435 [Bacteroidia bacterium]